MTQARIAVAATGVLAAFNDAGVLDAADLHVARRLGRLGGEHDDRVLLAVALAVRAVRSGSVCATLADRGTLVQPDAEGDDVTGVAERLLPLLPDPQAWTDAIQASPLVGDATGSHPERPVRLVGGRLYLDRYWQDEQLIGQEVDARVRRRGGVDAARLDVAVARIFGDPAAGADPGQVAAARVAAEGGLTVLTGGPGTGKTTTVARLVAVLQAVDGPGLRVALAAPTGKAAARLQEAVRAVVAGLPEVDRVRVGELSATTVHRLLGWRPGSGTRFAHHHGHPLPHDVVIVDETSMVALPLMARLLEAVRPDARLVLVGDPDQLASVEVGAVLGDLVARFGRGDPGPAGRVVRLDQVHRHGGAIADLARAVRAGDAEATMAILRGGHDDVELIEPAREVPVEAEIAGLRTDAERAGLALVRAARAADPAAALRAMESHRLLVAHRRGPFGVASWAARVEAWVRAADTGEEAVRGPWYPGRPLLVTVNDRETGLSNGDAGVIVAATDTDDAAPGSSVVAVFGDPDRPIRVRPHRLPTVETVHAMTVHRAQGSQFGTVSVLLPPATSPLLTRELLYTALTRARERVRIIAGEDAVRAAVARPVRRASGLRFP